MRCDCLTVTFLPFKTSELQHIIDQSRDYEETYKHLINAVVVNDNIHQAASSISSLVSDFENDISWIPASWEFEITPLPTNNSSHNKTILKPHDSSTGPSRRYEKKSTKPSVSSLPSNKVTITAPDDNSRSEPESDSNSESNLVMAKPIKYLPATKKADNSSHVVKPDEKQLKFSISKKSENPQMKIEEKPKKVSNAKKPELTVTIKTEEKPTKSSLSRSPKDAPPKKDDNKHPAVRHSNSQKTEDVKAKNDSKGREAPSNQNNDQGKPANTLEKNAKQQPLVATKPKPGGLHVSIDNRAKMPETIGHEESIKRNKPVTVQKPTAAVRTNDRRMKIVQKENSSSEISDTSSESDMVMKENRV